MDKGEKGERGAPAPRGTGSGVATSVSELLCPCYGYFMDHRVAAAIATYRNNANSSTTA